MMNPNLVVLTCMIHNSRPYHGFYKLFINSSPQPERALKDKIFFCQVSMKNITAILFIIDLYGKKQILPTGRQKSVFAIQITVCKIALRFGILLRNLANLLILRCSFRLR